MEVIRLRFIMKFFRRIRFKLDIKIYFSFKNMRDFLLRWEECFLIVGVGSVTRFSVVGLGVEDTGYFRSYSGGDRGGVGTVCLLEGGVFGFRDF